MAAVDLGLFLLPTMREPARSNIAHDGRLQAGLFGAYRRELGLILVRDGKHNCRSSYRIESFRIKPREAPTVE